jgi:ankyrin repeat protein
MLVKAGANVNYKKNRTGLTPLHWAAFNNDLDSVQYLLD